LKLIRSRISLFKTTPNPASGQPKLGLPILPIRCGEGIIF
jgi:hypothetical protein